MPATTPHQAINAVWRIEAPRLIAALARVVRDVGLAEELAQDALVAALEQWPTDGIPHNPAAWLMSTANHRAIDALRRGSRIESAHQALSHEFEAKQLRTGDLDSAIDENVGDDLLRLIFISCHPVLSTEARVALTLRLLGGLTTEEIARAFLVPEPTVAQRIVRAKKTLAEARVPFELPRGEAMAERLSSVLEVIYLVFNEGYAATAGDDWVRPELCEDALRLGRVLAALAPDASEVHGLVALMEIQASRMRARVAANGEPILLLEQNRARWDQLMISRGLAALELAQRLSVARQDQRSPDASVQPDPEPVEWVEGDRVHLSATQGDTGFALRPFDRLRAGWAGGERAGGPYLLQASIAAGHARARVASDTDWKQIAELYEVLAQVAPSPVIELNRAVALGMAYGPAAGLALADQLFDALPNYHLLPSVRGDLLFKLGRYAEARVQFVLAASLTRNAREQALLKGRAEEAARLSGLSAGATP